MSGARRQGREAALQILYFWEVGGAQAEAAIDAYFAEHLPDATDEVIAFAARLVHGTVDEVEVLDAAISDHSHNWRIERLAVIDRLILRLAVWELRHEGDTPTAVVLNEALELARRFSADESVKFINGVLDSIQRDIDRPEPTA